MPVGGERLEADQIVWAGGAWLAGLFPDFVDLRVTRQDVYFFGAPTGWQAPYVPGLGRLRRRRLRRRRARRAGVQGEPRPRGPGVRPGRRGPAFASDEKEREARDYLALRFPAWRAPLVGTRSCPYSLTEDTNFLIAPHPEHERVWLLGGGSGHGFKHGPALAEYVQGLLNGDEAADPAFGARRRGLRGGGLRRRPGCER